MIDAVILTPRADGSGLEATLVGALAALLSVWRVRAGTAVGFVVAQLAVVAIGWGRAGRILALAELTAREGRR